MPHHYARKRVSGRSFGSGWPSRIRVGDKLKPANPKGMVRGGTYEVVEIRDYDNLSGNPDGDMILRAPNGYRFPASQRNAGRDWRMVEEKEPVKIIFYRKESDGKYWIDLDGDGVFGIPFGSKEKMREAVNPEYSLEEI